MFCIFSIFFRFFFVCVWILAITGDQYHVLFWRVLGITRVGNFDVNVWAEKLKILIVGKIQLKVLE